MPAVVSGAQHGLPLSDDFAEASWGLRWSFDHPGRDEQGRAAFDGTGLVLQGNGSTPGDSSPMCVRAGDRAYVVEVELERLTEDAAGGLALFFNPRLYLGLHLDASGLTTYSGGVATWGREPVPAGVTRIGLRIENRHHIVTMWYRIAEGEWTQHSTRFETSGYHANTIQNLQSLRPALFATGRGSVRFRSFRYQALTE
jgi:beta-xylosidase